MNRKFFLVALLLIVACLHSALAQNVVLNLGNGQSFKYNVTDVSSITFEDESESGYVDLGLPSGTLWATMNVGAEKSEDYGYYFVWGETETKEAYGDMNYKYCQGTNRSFTKYCVSSEFGTVDNKTELEPEDDAATVNWGDGWQMPSAEQQAELLDINYTYSMWTTVNGVAGYRITSRVNGNSIFLPSAGCYDGSMHLIKIGSYLSRSLQEKLSLCYILFFKDNDQIRLRGYERSIGVCVRAVCK